MICPSSAAPRCSESPTCSATDPAESLDGCSSLYGPRFWNTYVASTLVTVAYAILFRYADFVTILGGSELQLGWIVGIGMVGSVLARFSLGSAIDQRGPKLIWLGSLAVFAITCFAHVGVTRCDGFAIYLLRIIYCTALAGIFGASTTFISGRVDIKRMAELVGILGTSGFVGMMIGTHLGDALAGSEPMERWFVDRMFVVAGLATFAAVPFAWFATRKSIAPAPHPHVPTLSILKQYHPGFVLVIGVVTGAALSLPQTFLRTYAADLDIHRIGIFFTVVASTAVATRVLNRRLPDRFGLATMIYVGLGLLALAQILYLVVRSEWQLVFPGLPYGIGQAILYPMVAAVGTATFPTRYRGLGITLVLASFDVGQLIGAPTAGAILHVCETLGVASYPTLFVATAVMLVVAGVLYWWTLQRRTSAAAAPEHAVILRFPKTAAQRRAAVSAGRPAAPVTVALATTPRPRAGNSRSSAAGRR
jgi:MFS family permease